jgi:hypothetical protein
VKRGVAASSLLMHGSRLALRNMLFTSEGTL